MASGIVSGTWGLSPQQVAGMNNVAQNKNSVPLTYNESLNSVVPGFIQNEFVSPLTTANNSYYVSFGKKSSRKMRFSSILKDIAFLRKV